MLKQNKFLVGSTSRAHPFLEYLSLFQLHTRIPNTLEEFADGVFLVQFSQLIKDFPAVEVVESPRTFQQRFANLKGLMKSTQRFWNEILGMEMEGEIDRVEVVRGSPQEIGRVLELLIKSAVQADNKAYFIQRMLLTSSLTQDFFKRFLEKVLNPDPKESPRKEKEKRMVDKIMQLDHENDKLQAVLRQVCQEKLQLQGRLKSLENKLSETTHELEQFEMILRQETFTPQKRKSAGVPDTSDRKDSLIDALRTQLNDMASQHERELQAALGVAERTIVKGNQFQQMRDELALSRQIIASHKEFRQQAQLMEEELSQAKADLMDRDNHIAVLLQQLERTARATADLQAALTLHRGELERKNLQIGQLIGKLEDMERRGSPRKGQSGNLLLDLPDLMNTEAQAYMDTNRSLREEVERSRVRLQRTEEQLAQLQQHFQVLQNCEAQNLRLRELVIELSSERGEENEILVSSLYHLSKMIRSGCL